MGTWGSGSFENDAALDWLAELDDFSDGAILRESFEAIIENDDYLDVDECCYAVVAAEVVAALGGKAAQDLPPEITAWLAEAEGLDYGSLRPEALQAIELVRYSEISELREIWEDNDSPPFKWYESIGNLLVRLTK